MIIKGQKINNRYQIIRSIGEGGMANVYLAYDTILDRNVAVKILRGDLSTDEKFVRRFQREAISASSLSHPNIVEMYDVGEDDGNYFIVMEYIDGKTLKSLIKRRGALTLPEVIDIMLQLTSAISCAHDSYIIHRDIKPQNVMILDDGRVKITDFGIAIASNATELTQTNSVMGSVHYLPPEQANGQGATIKSDIYSLGILMFELITGHVPFRGDNAVEIAIKQMKEPLPSVCKLVDGIPQIAENIILKACAKNPKNRYDSVREMYSDLRECLDEEAPIQNRVVYKYPEDDLEETKTFDDLKEVSRSEKNRKIARDNELDELEEKSSSKKLNVALWITGTLVGIIAVALFATIFVIPTLTKAKDVKIPDVSGMTVEKAEDTLMKAGLEVDVDVVEKESEYVKEGSVIETSPRANRTVKEGQTIKLTISTGPATIEIKNYVDKNYLEVKGALETLGLKVTVEKKDVENTTDKQYDPNVIIAQSIKNGQKVEKDTEIILYIPNILVKYPDFTKYTVEQATTWCQQNKVVLTVEYVEKTNTPVGTVIYQSRDAGEVVVENANLRITVVKAATTPTNPPVPTTPDNTSNEDK
jgi:serine/threonine-protein kinase